MTAVAEPTVPPTDTRPSEILRAVADGQSFAGAARLCGIHRKTLWRWREHIEGFGAALDQAQALASDKSEGARAEADCLVRAWSPGGLVKPTGIMRMGATEDRDAIAAEPVTDAGTVLEPAEHVVGLEVAVDPAPPPCSTGHSTHALQDTRPRPAAVEPDVLDSDGRELHRASEPEPAPYTKARPPTVDEWLAEMAAMARDKKQPERVRVTAIAAVSAGLLGGPGGRSLRPKEIDDLAVAQAARARGRDPGVSRSVWDQARAEFLGPAPGEAEESEEPANVVEIDAAQG